VKTLYFDLFSGAAGDMLVSSLIDLGADETLIINLPYKLGLEGTSVHFCKVSRGAISATYMKVEFPPHDHHRHLEDIVQAIQKADLPDSVAQKSITAFNRLANAEAKVHGCKVEEIHFHEVGAADAMIDVIGFFMLAYSLGTSRVLCSPPPLGSGSVVCAHGELPIPAPATAELLTGHPVAGSCGCEEMTTPTAAAILSTASEMMGPLPALKIQAVGYGAGSRNNQSGLPNVVRAFLGELLEENIGSQSSIVVEVSLDDINPQLVPALMSKLLKAGAADVLVIPCIMKKGRPGLLMQVVCSPDSLDFVIPVIFYESTTIGLRYHSVSRRVLDREIIHVNTPYGPVRMKVARMDGKITNASPEFEDCQKLAQQANVPIKEVFTQAICAWKENPKL